MNRYHATRSDFEERPRITRQDWHDLIGLLLFVAIFLGATLVVR
jgi:hypothetical protein